MAIDLVLFQRNNYGFSGPVVFRSKAQREGNGPVLVKYCNAAAGHHSPALACEARLAVNVDKLI